PVLQDDNGALHHWPYPQLGTSRSLTLAFCDTHQHRVVKRELSHRRSVIDRERQHSPIGKSNLPALVLLAASFLHPHRSRPVHVIERQPRIPERLLPHRSFVDALLVRLDALYCTREACLGAAKLNPPGIALIAPQAFLQCLLDRTL